MTRARDVSTPTALVLVKTQTIGTAVSSVTVSGAFSATFDNYKIIVSGGSKSTAGNITLKLGAAAIGYNASYVGLVYATAASSVTNDNNATTFTRLISGQTDGLNGNIDVLGPNLAKNTFVNGYQIETTLSRMAAGVLTNTTQFTAFTIAAASGTMTGGTIRVYGYQS